MIQKLHLVYFIESILILRTTKNNSFLRNSWSNRLNLYDYPLKNVKFHCLLLIKVYSQLFFIKEKGLILFHERKKYIY